MRVQHFFVPLPDTCFSGVRNAYRESAWRIGPLRCTLSAATERKPGIFSYLPFQLNRINLIASFYK